MVVYTNRRDKQNNQIEMRAKKNPQQKKKEKKREERTVSFLEKSSKHNIYVFSFFDVFDFFDFFVFFEFFKHTFLVIRATNHLVYNYEKHRNKQIKCGRY